MAVAVYFPGDTTCCYDYFLVFTTNFIHQVCNDYSYYACYPTYYSFNPDEDKMAENYFNIGYLIPGYTDFYFQFPFFIRAL